MTRDALDAHGAARLLCEHWRAGTALDSLPQGLRPSTRAEGHVVQALLPEVAGRSVVGWKIAATSKAGQAADNACCGRFVIGAPTGVDWRALDLRALQVHVRVSGTNGSDANGLRFERDGDGSAALGDARVALTWLANELRSLGIALRAGDVVSTGTCMVPLEVQAGDTVHADFGALGKLTVNLRD